jgi:processive 1,2-diacylglycerol beta-glucosyltransferase
VHLLMQVSDVIVTRGGTTTCAKALHFKCPIIFNASGGIMPQEELTWKYLRNGAASDKIENGEDFDRIIGSWLSDPEAYIRMRDNFLRLRYEEDPTILIDELVGPGGRRVRGEADAPAVSAALARAVHRGFVISTKAVTTGRPRP